MTNGERDYLIAYWFTEPLNNRYAMPEEFSQGFVAGLEYQNQQRIAFNEQTSAKLAKLIAFIKGEITRSEIEDLL